MSAMLHTSLLFAVRSTLTLCLLMMLAGAAPPQQLRAAQPASTQANGGITGIVRDSATNAPLDDISVQLYSSAGGFVTAVSSAGDGSFALSGLATASYVVFLVDQRTRYVSGYFDRTPDLGNAQRIAVTDGTTLTQNLLMDLGAVLTGTVRDEVSMAPIENIYVQAARADGSSVGFVATDSTGTYTMSALPAGVGLTVCFSAAGAVNYVAECHDNKPVSSAGTVFSLSTAAPSQINALLARGGTVLGRVTDENTGGGLASHQVYAYSANLDFVAATSSGATGHYTMTQFPGGAHVFCVSAAGEYLDECFDNKPNVAAQGTPVTVTGWQTTTNINFQLSMGGVISGRITSEQTGLPLAGVNVTAFNAAGQFARSGTSNAAGFYRLNKLGAGQYRLRATDNSGAHFTEFFNDVQTLAEATSITASHGVTVVQNMALAPGKRITGQVTDVETGAGIGGINVSVNALAGWSGSASANTDANGIYTTSVLRNGAYRVQFNAPSSGSYQSEVYDNRMAGTQEFKPVLHNGVSNTVNINAALRRSAGRLTLTGRITRDSDGAAVPFASVALHQATLTYATLYAYADGAGYFTATNVIPGQYRLLFADSNAVLAQEWHSNSATMQGAQLVTLATDATVNASLGAGGTITGRVTSSDMQPLQNAGVQIYDPATGYILTYVAVDADGYYTATGLPAAPATAYFFADNQTAAYLGGGVLPGQALTVPVAAGAVTPNVNYTFVRADAGETGALTGQVTEQGGAQQPAGSVQLYRADTNSFVKSAPIVGGAYAMAGVPPGTYKLAYFSNNASRHPPTVYHTGTTNRAEAAVITVTPNATATASVLVPLAAQITGTITANGQPSGGVLVEAVRVAGDSNSRNTYSDASGNYTLAGLSDGGYRLTFLPQAPLLREYYDDRPTTTGVTIISTTFGATVPNINAILASGGVITGRVSSEAGGGGASMPLPGASVTIFDQNGSRANILTVNPDGEYASSVGLPAGAYKVYASSGTWQTYAPEYYIDAGVTASATDIAVTAGATTRNVNFELAVAGIVRGKVCDARTGAILPATIYARRISDGAQFNTYMEGLPYWFSLPAGVYALEVYPNRVGFPTGPISPQSTFTVTAGSDQALADVCVSSTRKILLPMVRR